MTLRTAKIGDVHIRIYSRWDQIRESLAKRFGCQP